MKTSHRLRNLMLAGLITIAGVGRAVAAISASPNPCQATLAGPNSCTITITWNAGANPQGQVYVTSNGSPEIIFGCGQYGSEDATWIPVGTVVTFKLYAATNCSAATKGAFLGSVDVTGNAPTGAIAVSVNPTAATVKQAQRQNFSPTVANSSNQSVTWSLNPNVGSISSAGQYSAPASVTSVQNITVKATSQADNTKTAQAAVTLVCPDEVTTTSTDLVQNELYCNCGGGIQSPNLNCHSSPTAWAPFGPTCQAAYCTGCCSSNTPVSVTINPNAATVKQAQSQNFSPTVANSSNQSVTWSLSPNVGSISSTGLYSAPASVTTVQNVVVTATSQADNTKAAQAAVTLVCPDEVTTTSTDQTQNNVYCNCPAGTNTPNLTCHSSPTAWAPFGPSCQGAYCSGCHCVGPPTTISISPPAVPLVAGQAQQFSATVTGPANTAVTWTLSPAIGTLSSSGLYRAGGGFANPQTVTVTATSVDDPSKSAQATVQLAGFSPQRLPAPADRNTMLGITDWGGTYRLSTQGTQLEEEAQHIQDIGSDTIYVSLSYKYQEDYLRSDFGGPIHSLRELAQSAPFVHVFNQPFKTYIITAFSFVNRNNYLRAPDLDGEYQEMRDLATYLLQTYAGSGKTFILQNWEGDNAHAYGRNCDVPGGCLTSLDIYNFTPHPDDIQNMIDWINVRQRALMDARQAVRAQGVELLQTAEFNILSRARAGQVSVLSSVVPKVNTDLVSYSSYETIGVIRAKLRDQILNDMAFIHSQPGLNGRQIIIAEFGWDNYVSGLDADMRADIASQAFFDAGATRAIYWALYDNGSGQSLIDSSGNATPVGNTVKGLVNNQRKSPGTQPLPNIAGRTLTTSSVIGLTGTGSATQVNWAIAGQGAGPAVTGHALARTQQLMPYSGEGMLRVQTSEPNLALGSLGLAPGSYRVQAYTTDGSGNVSAPTSFDIVLVQATATSAAGVRVFPNPWKATTAFKNEVTIDGLTGHTTIKIFTLSGRSVRVLTTDANSTGWDMRNEEGDDVASGIYFYNITNDQDQHLRGKLVIIR